jgi:hypothetical protein
MTIHVMLRNTAIFNAETYSAPWRKYGRRLLSPIRDPIGCGESANRIVRCLLVGRASCPSSLTGGTPVPPRSEICDRIYLKVPSGETFMLSCD